MSIGFKYQGGSEGLEFVEEAPEGDGAEKAEDIVKKEGYRLAFAAFMEYLEHDFPNENKGEVWLSNRLKRIRERYIFSL